MSTRTLPRRSGEREALQIELLDVPSVEDLVARSKSEGVEYARVVEWTEKGKPSRWTTTAAGHALLGEIMRENGRRLAAAEAQRPPIVTDSRSIIEIKGRDTRESDAIR